MTLGPVKSPGIQRGGHAGSAGFKKETYRLIENYQDARAVSMTIMEPTRWVLDIMFKNGFRTTVDIIESISARDIVKEIEAKIAQSRSSLLGKFDHTIDGIASIVAGVLAGEAGVLVGSKPEVLEWTMTLHKASFRLFLDTHARTPWGHMFEYEEIMEMVKEHYSISDSS